MEYPTDWGPQKISGLEKKLIIDDVGSLKNVSERRMTFIGI